MDLTQRNIGNDALRVFSIAMVILGHSGSFEGSSLLSMWRMPLFFILSGLFLVPYRRSLRVEIARRWESLIIPYLAWSMIISLVVIALKWDDPADMLHHLYTGWRGGTGAPFIDVLLVFAHPGGFSGDTALSGTIPVG